MSKNHLTLSFQFFLFSTLFNEVTYLSKVFSKEDNSTSSQKSTAIVNKTKIVQDPCIQNQ